MKRPGYKYQIEQALLSRNWEIVEINSNDDWWDDEHWRVQLKFDPNLFFLLCFIVDPMFEGNPKKGQGIYEIRASLGFPKNWNDRADMIGSISMSKRKFDQKLEAFMIKLEEFKTGKIKAGK